MNVKDKFINAKVLLEKSIKVLNEIPCECDSYNGFECNLHSWKNRIAKIVEELHDGIEDEE